MKPFFRLAQLMIAGSLLFASCTPTPPPPTPTPTPTSTLPPPPPSGFPPRSTENPPLSLPDMYFVIDGSESMEWIKDSSGKFCDPTRLRYEIPLFIAQILKNWVEQGITKAPNLYLFLSDDQIPASITPDQMIAKLKYLLSNPTKSSIQPFDAAVDPDALQFVFNAAKDNDSVFLFTDGDFRKLHPQNDPFNSNANLTSIEVTGLFQNKPKSFKTFSFLLCTRSLESINNQFIKSTWEKINDQQDTVYGLGSPDLSDTTVLSDTIFKMLSDWLGDWNKSGNGYVTRGSDWLADGNISPVDNVTPDLLRLRYGAISFETGILNMKVQVDGNAAPGLDTSFPEYIDDFIPPTGQCGLHKLEFDDLSTPSTPPSPINHVFYWWWADTPRFYIDSGQPLVLYNNNSEDYAFTVRVSSSLNTELLKNINNDSNEFSRCLRFYVTMDDKNYPLEYKGDGKLLLENMINLFVNENEPLPNGDGVVPVTFWGVWYVNSNSLFSVGLLSESQNTQIAKIRYYPVIGNRIPLSATPTPGVSQEIKLQIPLDFFEEKYYPLSVFQPERWQPSVVFLGKDCSPSLTTPVPPPYPRGRGGQAPVFDVKTIQVGESGLEITIDMDSNDNLKKCNQLILSWDKWPSDIEDWQAPPPIELVCSFESSILECK